MTGNQITRNQEILKRMRDRMEGKLTKNQEILKRMRDRMEGSKARNETGFCDRHGTPILVGSKIEHTSTVWRVFREGPGEFAIYSKEIDEHDRLDSVTAKQAVVVG
jgi:hypothetical protein